MARNLVCSLNLLYIKPSFKLFYLLTNLFIFIFIQKLERHIRSILNKLTPQKFKTLVGNMAGLKIDSVEKLELVAHMIFETAIHMPLYSHVAYANMSRVMTDAVSKISNYHKYSQVTAWND